MTVRSTIKSRDAILAGIRTSLGVTTEAPERRVTIQKRLYDHPEGVIPKRSLQDKDGLIAQFRTMLESQSATFSNVGHADEIPERIAEYLRDNNLPAALRLGADERLAAVDWPRAPQLSIANGPAQPDDAVGLSHALAGVSETGTLVLVSGEDNPTTLNFLPETHIVVVRRDDIVGPYEAAWAKIREVYGERTMPRTVNLISGPSRTADIEQTIIMGAHGPKRLHVIMVAG